MVELKLGKLPDRTPLKLSISIRPALHRALEDYARLYEQVHGAPEPIVELIPAMLESFLDSDKAFRKALTSRIGRPMSSPSAGDA
jgi:hypothetical protein